MLARPKYLPCHDPAIMIHYHFCAISNFLLEGKNVKKLVAVIEKHLPFLRN